jgi:tRNA nucleotidyltransferase (CCA-adding enzyme)
MTISPPDGKNSLKAGLPSLEQIALLLRDPAILTLTTVLGADAQLHLVGGSVRDALVGLPTADIDVATILQPQEVMRRLELNGIRVIATGIEHGTVLGIVEEAPIEITTFRKPGNRVSSEYSDTIEEDLRGRDFTINALAVDIASGALVDPHSGFADLTNNVLRAVDDPIVRFSEDPLRIMRMFRFGFASGRHVDAETLRAAVLGKPHLATVSIERIRDEFVKILMQPYAREALLAMVETGIMADVVPECLPAVGFEQNEYHNEDVFGHTLTVVSNAPVNVPLRLAAFFHDLGKPHTLSVGDDGRRHFYLHEMISTKIARAVMQRMKFSKDMTAKVTALVALHMRPLTVGPAGLRRLLRDTGEHFDEWLLLKQADKSSSTSDEDLANDLLAFNDLLKHERERQADPAYGKLQINGDQIKALGVSEGPIVGAILHTLNEELLEHPERNRPEWLLKRAKRLKEKLHDKK